MAVEQGFSGLYIGMAMAGSAIAAGPLKMDIGDIGALTALAVLGIAARHARATAQAREQATARGVPKAELPSMDFTGLAIDLMTAPMVGPGTFAAVEMANYLLKGPGVPDYAFAPLVIGGGYWAPQLIGMAWKVISGALSKLPGGKPP